MYCDGCIVSLLQSQCQLVEQRKLRYKIKQRDKAVVLPPQLLQTAPCLFEITLKTRTLRQNPSDYLTQLYFNPYPTNVENRVSS